MRTLSEGSIREMTTVVSEWSLKKRPLSFGALTKRGAPPGTEHPHAESQNGTQRNARSPVNGVSMKLEKDIMNWAGGFLALC